MKKITSLIMLIVISMVAKAQTQSTAQFMQQLNIQTNNTPENYFRVMDSLMVVLHGKL
jgi:hypothetical protein